jgi:hypothetical protein
MRRIHADLLDAGILDSVEEQAQTKKIPAIKRVREVSGCGLKEGKFFVENIRAMRLRCTSQYDTIAQKLQAAELLIMAGDRRGPQIALECVRELRAEEALLRRSVSKSSEKKTTDTVETGPA